jgi:hypothetical protein
LLRLDIPTPDEDVKAVNNPTIENSIRGARDYTENPLNRASGALL